MTIDRQFALTGALRQMLAAAHPSPLRGGWRAERDGWGKTPSPPPREPHPAAFGRRPPRKGEVFQRLSRRMGASRPVSRVLYGADRFPGARVTAIPLGRSSPTASSNQPGRHPGDGLKVSGLRSPLFGFAPGGACHALGVTVEAVRSYRTLSPLPGLQPGGLLSVALSLGSPPPDVIRRRVSVEPGLSSA